MPALFDYGNMIRYDPTLVDPTSNFFVLCLMYKCNFFVLCIGKRDQMQGLSSILSLSIKIKLIKTVKQEQNVDSGYQMT